MAWSIVIGLAAICAVVGWLAIVANRRQRIMLGMCAAAVVVGVFAWWPVPPPARQVERPGPSESVQAPAVAPAALPQPAYEAGFVSASECRNCHEPHYDTWHRTFHRTMTQAAAPESVKPAWDEVTLSSRGRTYRLFRREDEFWVDTVDPAAEVRAFIDGTDLAEWNTLPRVTRQIVMTTGSHVHQTYWMQNPNGVLIQFPWVYHINSQRWVYRIDSFLRPPTDVVTYNIWNMTCIACHTTGGQPRVDPATRAMHSVGELGIACEACHGSGRAHVALARSDPQETPDDWQIVHPRKCSAEVSSQICGQCHVVSERTDERRWLQTGDPYRAGGENFNDIRRVVLNSADLDVRDERHGHSLKTLFWPDSTVRTGGREYNGLLRSRCYTDGQGERRMSCLSCHSMHDYISPNKLISNGMDENRACTQCHQEERYDKDLPRHTHHAAASSGSRCVNCHMPHTSYALFSAIRSHRIQSPQTRPGQTGARPNACNLCHLDRSLDWTVEHLAGWYEIRPPAEPQGEEVNIAASVLWLLKGDAAQRAVAAWHMGWEPAREASAQGWIPALLASALDDPYSGVRYMAYEVLKKQVGYERFAYEFDGPASERKQAVRRALEIWEEQQGRLLPDEMAARLLITTEGVRDEATVGRLLEEQDSRPITILE